MNTSIRSFLREEDGVTALEYGILAAVVAVTIAAVFGDSLKAVFATLFAKVTSAVSGSSSGGGTTP